MNNIKRKNKLGTTLLSYKFGFCEIYGTEKLIHRSNISEKILKFSVVNKRIIFSKYILHNALEKKLPGEFIKYFINDNLDVQDGYNNTPLHIAIINKYDESVIRILITKNNLDMKNYFDNTPFQISLNHGRSEDIVKLLITRKNVIIERDSSRNTPLYLATVNNYSEEFINLIKQAMNKIDKK